MFTSRLIAGTLAAASLLALPDAASAAGQTRVQEPEPAPAWMQETLDRRAAQGTILDSTRQVLWESAAKGEDPLPFATKGGFVGEREGDMDPDLRFYPGEPGIARTFLSYGSRLPEARAVMVSQTATGGLLVAGQVGLHNDLELPTRVGLMQYRPNGNFDPGFGVLGIQIFELSNPRLELISGAGLNETLNGITWDRVYLLARDFEQTSGQRFALICLRRQTGSNVFEACPGFPSGIRYYALGMAASCPTDDSVPHGMHLERSNPPSLFMVGSTRRIFNDCQDQDWALIKVQVTGDLDTSFAGTGQLAYWVPNGTSPSIARAHAISVRRNGEHSVVAGGSTGTGAAEAAILAQFNANGTIDTGFCATSNLDCPSPSAHRDGRRAWDTPLFGSVRAIAHTFGDGIYAVRRVGQIGVPGRRALVSRVDSAGGCSFMCNQEGMNPNASGFFNPVEAFWRPSRSGLGFQLTIVGWGNVPDGGERTQAYVYRFRDGDGVIEPDFGFVTRPEVSWRQDIDWPFGTPDGRDARIHAAALDREGRVMIAGTSRAFLDQYDMSLARLRGDPKLFSSGFE